MVGRLHSGKNLREKKHDQKRQRSLHCRRKRRESVIKTRIEPRHSYGANFLYLDGHAGHSTRTQIPAFSDIAIGRDIPQANYSGTFYN